MIVGGVCATAKRDFLRGVHQPRDIYMVALYTPNANLNPSITEYTRDGEVRGKGYEPGGQRLEGLVCDVDGYSAYWSFTKDVVWKNATISAAGALVYNASKKNAAILVIDFGELVVSTNGNWVLPMPSINSGRSLIRWI